MCKRSGSYGIVQQRGCGVIHPVPLDCGDPLCPECERVRAAERRERWLPVLQGMRSPRMITLSEISGWDLDERKKHLHQSMRKLFDLRLGPRRWPELKADAEAFVSEHFRRRVIDDNPDVDHGKAITTDEYIALVHEHARSIERFAGTLSRYHARKGKWPRVRDIIGVGFATFEVTFSERYGWHVHRHLTVDGQFIPWSVLCAAWMHVTAVGDLVQGKVVDIRAVDKKSDQSIKETVKYLTKPWDVPADRVGEFRRAVRGVKRVWPLGGARPVEPDHTCPYCGSLECRPVLAERGSVSTETTIDGRPAVVIVLEGGRSVSFAWLRELSRWEQVALDLITKPFACQSQMALAP